MATVKPSKTASARRGNPQKATSDADIARRAFELFEERGAQHGRDLEDWLRAEAELLRRSTNRDFES